MADPGGGNDPDNKVRIIGALVNPIGPAPESEWITILNTTPDDIDLTGGGRCSTGSKQRNAARDRIPAGRRDHPRLGADPPFNWATRAA